LSHQAFTTRWTRYLAFLVLFLFVPLGIAGFLTFFSLAREEEARFRREVEALERDVSGIVCATDPQYHLERRLQAFRRNLFAGPLTEDRIRSLVEEARRRIGFVVDPYVFDGDWRLVTPPDIELRSRRLIQKFWNFLVFLSKERVRRRRILPPGRFRDSSAAHREYLGIRDTLVSVVGERFHASNVIDVPGYPLHFSREGGGTLFYWDDDERTAWGGLIVVVWQPPTPRQILSGLFHRRKRTGLSVLAREPDGPVRRFGRPVSPALYADLERTLERQGGRWCVRDGRLWVRSRTGDLTLFVGRPLRPQTWLWTGRAVGVALALLCLAGIVLPYRWMVQGRDWFVPIRVKLILLFLFAVLIPTMGVAFLAVSSVRDATAARTVECFKAGHEVLSDLDESFLAGQREFVTAFRAFREVIRRERDPRRMRARAMRLRERRIAGSAEGRDLEGKVVFTTEDDPESTGMNQVYETFTRMVVRRYVPERLPPGAEDKVSVSNLGIQMALESQDTGFHFITRHPDQMHLLSLPRFRNLIWFDFFREPDHPVAVLLMGQPQARAIDSFLRRRLARRHLWAHEHGAFRVFAGRFDRPGWYPAGFEPDPVLAGVLNRLRVTGEPLAERVSWRGRPWLAVGLPGKNTTGYGLIALYPEGEITRSLDTWRRILIGCLLLGLAVSLLTGLMLSDTFLAPIGELADGIGALRRGDTTWRVPALQKDELGNLALAFNDLMEGLHEVNLGRQVQERLLPKVSMEFQGYRVFGVSRPATQMGGDYFDYLTFGGERLGVVIGDVTGHGVPAALVMAMVKAMVGLTARFGHPPDLLFQTLTENLYRNMQKSLLMSMGAAFVDPVTHGIDLYTYGHLCPFHRSATGTRMLSLRGSFPLGIRMQVPQAVTPFRLEPGEELVFYTDGLVESLELMPEIAGTDQFGRLADFFETCPRGDPEETCRAMLDRHPFLRTGLVQPDDVTVVVLRRDR